MKNFSINKKKITEILAKSFSKAIEQLADDSQAMIADDRWQWPRQTKRKNSDLVGSPRDIVDEGEFYDSLIIAQNGNKAELIWDDDKATAIALGATTKNGTELPARNWVEAAIEETTAGEVFERSILRNL